MFGMTDKQLLTLTDSAAERVKSLMKLNDKAIGLKVGVKNGRAAADSPTRWDYAEEASGTEDVIEDKGVKLLIEPTAAMFLLGTELDWHEDKLEKPLCLQQPQRQGHVWLRRVLHRLITFRSPSRAYASVRRRFSCRHLVCGEWPGPGATSPDRCR